MAEHNARVMELGSAEEALAEIVGVGATAAASRWMADEATMRVVRLEAVSGRAASILKQEALALGAECAVARSVAAFDDTPRPVVLIATLRQHEALARKLAAQPFGLRALAEQVRQALAAYDRRDVTTLKVGRHGMPIGERTLIMGIINTTPDSFSGDGVSDDVEAALSQGKRFAEEGADLLDVGGQSTRPGSEEVSADEEKRRVLPVIERLSAEVDLPVSIDTDKAEVAGAALDAGAGLVNDVCGLQAEGMLELVAERRTPVCVMHMLGTPRTMQEAPTYEDVIADIYRFLAERVATCEAAGLTRQQVIIDPGIGFGKTVSHNLTILRRLREFRSLGCPIMVGVSRKSTIGKVLDLPPEERLEGTAAACACAILNGADIIRVHDVREMVRVARMTDAIMRGWPDEPSGGAA
ncbi:MAG: dihydropteroate synthase [Armatimonadetes bacterium]|nr:dihydropteroate synthase [Armatimonadota bacterium]